MSDQTPPLPDLRGLSLEHPRRLSQPSKGFALPCFPPEIWIDILQLSDILTYLDLVRVAATCKALRGLLQTSAFDEQLYRSKPGSAIRREVTQPPDGYVVLGDERLHPLLHRIDFFTRTYAPRVAVGLCAFETNYFDPFHRFMPYTHLSDEYRRGYATFPTLTRLRLNLVNEVDSEARTITNSEGITVDDVVQHARRLCRAADEVSRDDHRWDAMAWEGWGQLGRLPNGTVHLSSRTMAYMLSDWETEDSDYIADSDYEYYYG